MQRLLRGRLLYLVLGLLVVLLYARTMSFRPAAGPLQDSQQSKAWQPLITDEEAAPFSEAQAQHRSATQQRDTPNDWWPKGLDASVLQQAIGREPRVMLAVSILVIFIAGMWVGGFLLAVWSLWSGRIRSIWRFLPPALPPWSFAEVARILFLTILIASLLPFVRIALLSRYPTWDLDHHLWMTVSMVFLDLFVMLAILTFTLGKGTSVMKTLGFSTATLSKSIEVGFLGYVAVFPWLFVLLFLVIAAARFFGFEPPMEPIHELLFQEQRPLVLGLTVLLACVVGPVAEELFFRGIVYPAIRQRTSHVVAMLVSASLFSLIHTNILGFLPIMVLGCLLAHLYERTGSLASPLAVHMLHNTFLLTLAMVFRKLLSLT